MLLELLLLSWAVSSARCAPQTRREVTKTSKAGLAWPNGNFDDVDQYTRTGKVSWYYTWSPFSIDSDLEFVPMLWGSDQAKDFSNTIDNTIKRNDVSAVLGFNEPQEKGQSKLSPQDGASLWIQYIEPLKERGIRLGTPAPSSNPNGKVWIQDWLNACNGSCNPDFVALHYYDINATQFQTYLEDFHNTFNLPIWVTEWADHNFNNGPQPSPSEVVAFLNQTQTFMDATDWVERYAWFGVMQNLQGVDTDNAMMSTDGKITNLGLQYIGAISAANNSNPTVSSSARTSASPNVLLAIFTGLCFACLL